MPQVQILSKATMGLDWCTWMESKDISLPSETNGKQKQKEYQKGIIFIANTNEGFEMKKNGNL